ncbi:DUF3558 domain-containing protein [Nocardia farcinica]|nr:DUF3558 domain-containing protein [Nocardia farcinica]MBF6311605.1 DUF3558 domain-containing protein [Nocardia farcinica]MBF6408589.1 DUF3558 domain-containing protein [Nocardia farcinica]PEH76669.1 hypothetical protein CRM89_12285 [Nocardia sp. FDAARGOS_372]
MSVGSPAVGRGRRSRSAPRCPRIPASEGCWMGSRSVVGGVLALGVVVVLGGCDSSVDGDAGPAGSATVAPSSEMAPKAPAGFDPCADIPQELLDSEGLRLPSPQNSTGPGGIEWKGCMWVQTDGVTATIQVTNITVEMVKARNLPDSTELNIGGRSAISSRRSPDHPDAVCTLNVQMVGGSMEFNLSNPPSRKKTGHLDTCELTRALAEKVVPTIPAGA